MILSTESDPKGSRRSALGRAALAILSVLAAVACGRAPEPSLGDHAIRGPLRPATLIEGDFVAYSIQWQVDVPGGDSIVFAADQSVTNLRAGLRGTWSIIDDSTLQIDPPREFFGTNPQLFRLRPEVGDMIRRVGGPDAEGGPVTWIRRRGAGRPLE